MYPIDFIMASIGRLVFLFVLTGIIGGGIAAIWTVPTPNSSPPPLKILITILLIMMYVAILIAVFAQRKKTLTDHENDLVDLESYSATDPEPYSGEAILTNNTQPTLSPVYIPPQVYLY